MKSVLLVICIICFSLQACSKYESECHNADFSSTQDLQTVKISSETAIQIAKGYLCFDYNLKNYDISTSEKPDSWEIKFVGRGSINEETGPIVYINKINGERIYIIHSK